MKRRAPHERVERFRIARVQEEGAELRARVEAWAAAHREDVARAYETVEPPGTLNDRARDCWSPLFAVVAVADPSRLPELERVALRLSGEGVPAEEESVGVRLLADVRRVFAEAGVDRLPTEKLREALAEVDEAPWGDWHGRPITPQALARLLRPFGVRPDKWREGDQTVRGYALAAFEDAFTRYLPPDTSEPPQSPQPSSDGHSGDFGEPPQTPLVADAQNGRKPRGCGPVADVAVSTPGTEGPEEIGTPEAPPEWAVELAEGLPRQPGTDPEAVARAAATLLGPPLAPEELSPASAAGQDLPTEPCRVCGGRRWWKRPPSCGGGWLCGRCRPPGLGEPVAWHFM